MSALELPPPTKRYEGDDVLETAGATAVDGSSTQGVKKSETLLKGMIYPSREIRGIIDKTALYIANSSNPQPLEDRIREYQKADPKFSFLRDSDPFNRYYRYMIERVKEDGEDVAMNTSATGPTDTEANESVKETEQDRLARESALLKRQEPLEEPRSFEFTTSLPNVTTLDLDVLRLTALFTARRGRSFLDKIASREARNFQFDFLRPSHSLYGYFNRMVEQYNKVLHPSDEQIELLKKGTENRWETLDDCRKRGEWEKVRKDKELKKKEESEKEALAFAEIDWQDFAVVQTIEFTSADESIELPPPTSVEALRTMGLNEKRMAAMIVEETADGDNGPQQGKKPDANGEMDVEVDDESESDETTAQKKREAEELARAKEVQAKAMGQAGLKIRKDYQPKGLAGRQAARAKVAMAVCPYCKQSIPESEISEHIRIELLDPRWREQKQFLEQRKTQQAQLIENADVAGSLKKLASARTDLFGTAEEEEKRKQQEEAERAARKAKEAIIWDGHTASKTATLETFQSRFNLDEQIAAIHRKNIGVSVGSGNAIGPQMGTPQPPAPVEMPPAHAAGVSTPGGGTAFTGASISAGPSGPSQPTPVQHVNPYGQFVPFPDQPAFDPSMFNSSPMPAQSPSAAPMQGEQGAVAPGLPPKPPAGMGMHPSRMAVLGGDSPHAPFNASGSPVPPIAGQVRPHEGTPPGQEDGSAKRPRIEKVPGQLYPEADWIKLHPDPISISVQLPNMPEKPEWKLNGSIITIADLTLSTLVSTLRDRIASIVEAPLPISRMRLDYGPKVLSNASTLASVNMDEADMIALTIRKK